MRPGILRQGAAPAVVLAAAAGLVWVSRASWWGVGAAALGALLGALAAQRLAETRVRTVSATALAIAAAGGVLVVLKLLGLAPVPGAAPWPEVAATVRDAGAEFVLSGCAAFVLRLLGARRSIFAALPAAALALAAASLLAPHRGGAINRPFAVSDLAWIRGWPPTLLFSATGVAAALVGVLALAGRRRGARGAWIGVLLYGLLGLAALEVAPAFGLLHFPTKDPLGLSGEPAQADESTAAGRGRASAGRPGAARGDRLGLLTPEGGRSGEMVPFQDDYNADGAQVPVAVVVLRDDVEPTGGALYFRQVAFSVWNGRRLVRALDTAADPDVFEDFSSATRSAPGAGDVRAELGATMALLRDHQQPPVLANGELLAPLENNDPTLFRRVYQTRSAVLVTPFGALFGRRAGDAGWDEATRRAHLEIPNDPRYGRLAQEILRTLKPELTDDPWARALAVGFWLQTNTLYSAHSHHAAADDPTASYLFGDRTGYCVHLAHAAAYLSRALGVPSRVAAGYAYTARDRAGGSSLLLRSGDAHAWAEVYLDGAGWVPIDPSPPSLDPPLPAPDLDLQRLLGELARPGARGGAAAALHRWPRLTWRAGLLALLSFGLTWSGAGFAVKGWRRWAPLVRRADPGARLSYRASLDRLAEAGLARARGETREAFARRARAVAPAFEHLTEVHLAARFGRRPADRALARRTAREVRRQVSRNTGLRRWRGVLAPWRWTRSR